MMNLRRLGSMIGDLKADGLFHRGQDVVLNYVGRAFQRLGKLLKDLRDYVEP